MNHCNGIRTVLLLWLLLSGITSSYAQDYSTRGEIFDYEVGDIFHLKISDWVQGLSGHLSYQNIEILTKEMATDSNSVTYTQSWIMVQYSEGQTNYFWGTESLFYDDLSNHYIADTVYTTSNYNGRKVSQRSYSGIENDIEWRKYVDGCGLAYKYYQDWGPPLPYGWTQEGYTELIYYKKGDEEWGTPYIVVGVEETKDVIEHVILYPNPFITSTTIEYELTEPSHIQLTIYNAIGETTQVAIDSPMPVGKHTFTWSPEGLTEGLFYGVLRSKEGVSVVKMIKQ